MDTRAWIPRNVTFVNKAAFDALDKPTQEALLKAASVAEERGWKVWESKTEWYHDEIAKKGMKVLKPSPALEAGFKFPEPFKVKATDSTFRAQRDQICS